MGYYDSVYSEELPHRAISVYMYLKERADKNSQCYPAMSTIAEELKLSRRTIQRAVADLEKAGFIKTEQRFRRKGGKIHRFEMIGLHQGDTLHFRCPMVCVTMAHEGNIPLRDSLLKQKKIRPFKTAVHSGVSGK